MTAVEAHHRRHAKGRGIVLDWERMIQGERIDGTERSQLLKRLGSEKKGGGRDQEHRLNQRRHIQRFLAPSYGHPRRAYLDYWLHSLPILPFAPFP